MAEVGNRPQATPFTSFNEFYNGAKMQALEIVMGAALINAMWNSYQMRGTQAGFNGATVFALVIAHDAVEEGMTADNVAGTRENLADSSGLVQDLTSHLAGMKKERELAQQTLESFQRTHKEINEGVVKQHEAIVKSLKKQTDKLESIVDLALLKEPPQVIEIANSLKGKPVDFLKEVQRYIQGQG